MRLSIGLILLFEILLCSSAYAFKCRAFLKQSYEEQGHSLYYNRVRRRYKSDPSIRQHFLRWELGEGFEKLLDEGGKSHFIPFDKSKGWGQGVEFVALEGKSNRVFMGKIVAHHGRSAFIYSNGRFLTRILSDFHYVHILGKEPLPTQLLVDRLNFRRLLREARLSHEDLKMIRPFDEIDFASSSRFEREGAKLFREGLHGEALFRTFDYENRTFFEPMGFYPREWPLGKTVAAIYVKGENKNRFFLGRILLDHGSKVLFQTPDGLQTVPKDFIGFRHIRTSESVSSKNVYTHWAMRQIFTQKISIESQSPDQLVPWVRLPLPLNRLRRRITATARFVEDVERILKENDGLMWFWIKFSSSNGESFQRIGHLKSISVRENQNIPEQYEVIITYQRANLGTPSGNKKPEAKRNDWFTVSLDEIKDMIYLPNSFFD